MSASLLVFELWLKYYRSELVKLKYCYLCFGKQPLGILK